MTSRYAEGDWLWIPLEGSGQFAIGRIARIAPRGKILTVYAFGPPRTTMPTAAESEGLRASLAATVGMCGDLGILTGKWGLIVHQGTFERAAWPMPAFGRWTDSDYPGVRVEYPADAPNTDPVETLVPYEQARELPPDGIYGYEAFESHLCIVLGVPYTPPKVDEQLAMAQHYIYFSSERVAKSAAKQMIRAVPDGTVETKRSDEEWLVILSHRLVDDAIGFDDVVDRLTRIAAQRHGRYDGWERG